MVKKLTTLMMALCCHVAFAATDMTEFQGIPVGGSVERMSEELASKGWVMQENEGKTRFAGKFNGMDMYVYLFDKDGEVYRLMACDGVPREENEAMKYFNTLVDMLNRDENLEGEVRNRYITSDENIAGADMNDMDKYDARFHNKDGKGGETWVRLHTCGPALWAVTMCFDK